MDSLDVDPGAMARSAAYKLLAEAFVPWAASDLGAVASATSARAEGLARLAGADPELRPLVERLRDGLASLPAGIAALEDGMSVVFGTPAPFPPYEGEYGMAHVFMKLQTMADVAGLYKAFGVEVGPDFKDRPDHLAAELEFMYFLVVKQASAAASRRDDLAEETRRAETIFLGEHLGAWAPGFLRAVASGGENPFFARVAEFGADFLRMELTHFGISPKPTEITKPSRAAEPEDGCPMAPQA